MEWYRTQLVMERLKGKNPYKRHIIHRDSKILSGVYPGASNREVLVVDPVKYPELKKLYAKVVKRILLNGFSEKSILRNVYDVVNEKIKVDSEATNRFIEKYNLNGKKVSLDVFIKEGIGSCRHTALACGALIEMLIEDGYLKGKVSVDRNSIADYAHAWARYEFPNKSFPKEVYALDVARNFFGDIRDENSPWIYLREEDL